MKSCFASLAILASIAVPTTASAADPLDQSCGLIQALVEGGGEEAALYLKNTLAAHWPEAHRNKLYEGFQPMWENHDYIGGNVYLIADLGGDVQEHLFTVRVENQPMLYLRATYSHFSETGIGLAYLTLEDEFRKISDPAFVQEPVLLSCE